MKQKRFVVWLVLGLLLTIIAFRDIVPSLQIRIAMWEFSDSMASGIPEDLRLTIYFVDPGLLTRNPWSVEDLINAEGVKVIEVTDAQLRNEWPLTDKIDTSMLQSAQQKGYLNARLYYVFKTHRGKLLDVAISDIGGHVFVNGIEVEHNSLFYEIILPFLTGEDRQMLGI